ncbi:MAG: hypothetical protein HY787_26690 [Deltaproteobacteria bacterium]|nr:hypothetical protein [Deltaproteobacteria bacterium]
MSKDLLIYPTLWATFGTGGTTCRVTSQLVQIFGVNDCSQEYTIEKIFQDAQASMIQDGINEALVIGAFSRL